MSNGWFFFNIFGSALPGQPDQLPTDYDHSLVSGPLVNVDGTPMLTDAFDVVGKPYGDTGSSLSDSHVMFDAGISTSCSDW